MSHRKAVGKREVGARSGIHCQASKNRTPLRTTIRCMRFTLHLVVQQRLPSSSAWTKIFEPHVNIRSSPRKRRLAFLLPVRKSWCGYLVFKETASIFFLVLWSKMVHLTINQPLSRRMSPNGCASKFEVLCIVSGVLNRRLASYFAKGVV